MATCAITIEIPEELAQSLRRKVPAEEQPQFVAEALRRSLRSRLTVEEKTEREALFERACNVLEGDPDLEQLDCEMDVLNDDALEESSIASEAR